jgi:hypothetical protein
VSESNGRFRLVDDPDLQPMQLQPVAFSELASGNPTLRQPVIHGILRRGEVANIIAAPKTGKSFLAGGLAWSVATGQPWLSHQVEQGRVLILDNELHPETLASRLTRIADEMMIDLTDRGLVDVISLRGQQAGIDNLSHLLSIQPGTYQLVVVDALYRALPDQCSENDNAAMMRVYNHLDALAEQWQSSIVIVHHSSKGQQGDKALTDVGAGAGSISRAADTHIAIRPHETDGHFVLEAVTRSFKSPEPVSVKFEWPLWEATTLAPEVKRQTRQNVAAQQAADDSAISEILDRIPDGKPIMQSELFRRCGLSNPKGARLMSLIESRELASRKERRKRGQGKKYVFWQRVSTNC